MTRTSRSVRGLTTFFLMLLLLGVGNALGAAPDSENLQSTRGEPAVFLNIWISDPKELSLTPLTRLKPNSRYVLVLDVSPQSYESRRVFGESLVSIRASVLEQYLNSQRTADASVHAELSWESQEDHQKSVQGRITVDRRIDDRTISGTSDEHEQAILREDPRFVLGREILSFDTGTQEGTLELRMKMSTTTGTPIGTIVIESCVV